MMNEVDPSLPVIVMGSHRAGTTMMAGILEQVGVFMGRKKDANNEALFFRELNRWLFRSAHAHWDYPAPFLGVLQDMRLRETYRQYLQILLSSPRLVSYLGMKNYLKYRYPGRLTFPWGWKDPRNTFTLPLWLEVFRGAKVIHVRRHGVDVAGSLVARNVRSRENGIKQFERWRAFPVIYGTRPKRGNFVDSLRCRFTEDAFDLWQEYTAQAEAVLRDIEVPVLDLRYEKILEQPEIELEKLLRFCDMTHMEGKIPEIAARLNPDRAFAFRNNPRMCIFASDHAERLKRFGYWEQ